MDIKEIAQRNMPVLVIGGITVLIFLFIIGVAQRNPNNATNLIEVDEQELIAPHTYVQGPAGAKVTLVEFTDFGCPACKSFHPFVKEALEKYEGHIKYGLRHFPLPQHKNADKAAAAAQAAGEQGKFWEYDDALFEFQPAFEDEDLMTYADLVNLDLDKFKTDYENSAFHDIVAQDVRFGRQIGVNSTPTFFLNGKQLKLSNFSDLDDAISRALIEAGVDINAPTEEELREEAQKTEEFKTNIFQAIDDKYGTLEIEYTEEDGFLPDNAQANPGQLVRWTNTSEEDITFIQLMNKYSELEEPFVIEAGESFEYRLELREHGLWTYQFEGDIGRSSLTVNKLPPEIEALLPENVE